MRKYLSALFLILLITGCSRQNAHKDILARVNNYEITKEEFNEEFRLSPYAKTGTAAVRKEFLGTLIDRKLILQDAQKKGLDRDVNFLNMIQRFWEQSLLKLAIEKKINELAASSMSKSLKTKEGEGRLLNGWIVDLKKKADIKVNYNLLEEK